MRLLFLATLLISAAARGEPAPEPAPVLPDQPIPETAPVAEARNVFENAFENFHSDPDAYSIVSVARGLSTHKPMFVLPVTYSRSLDGHSTEVMFQISAKQRLFARDLYFGYTQKSFWQLYNHADSSPFRESDYNPELFYRWAPDPARFNHWGADIGYEHESNGQRLPVSRSWNRLYIAPFQAKGNYLMYFKLWYRLPETPKSSPADASGDDNPDIEHYYGHGEFQVQRQFFGRHLAHLMVRGNFNTGKGAVNLNYSIPSSDGSLFYGLYLFHGYGESLIDYNHSITRIGVGIMLAR